MTFTCIYIYLFEYITVLIDEYNGNNLTYETTSSTGYNEGFLGNNNAYYSASSSASSFDGLNQQGFTGTTFTNGSTNNNFGQKSPTVTNTYNINAQGLYQDPNPQVIRRPAVGGAQTYTQRVTVKFLKPPPLPPPGVSIFSNENQ